ncbi:MAG: phage holin [Clostridia bacterium]|nr:phage holin [Clostridia bacterium]
MNISVGTLVRTLLLLLALVNQVLTAFGVSPLPIADETVTEVVSLLFTTVTAVMAWWKNNSFTAPAIEADALLEELRQEI